MQFHQPFLRQDFVPAVSARPPAEGEVHREMRENRPVFRAPQLSAFLRTVLDRPLNDHYAPHPAHGPEPELSR